jgi:fumarate reductase flavoprotein subunit
MGPDEAPRRKGMIPMRTKQGNLWLFLAALLLLVGGAAIAEAQSKETSVDTQHYTAHVHLENGLTCAVCHGDGPKKPVTREKCQECHGTYKDLAQRTTNYEPNPHYNHTIDLSCDSCHHMHKPQQVYCQKCHAQLQFTKQPAAPDKEGK